jgi:putative endopeptidase
MDTLVNPGDNFDAYVNGTWVKTIKFQLIKLPTVLLMSCMINLKRCKSDYRRSIKRYFTEGSDEQKIGDYYSSFMNRKDRDAKGIAPIQPELKNIDAIANYSDLAAYFGKSEQVFQCLSLLSLPKILNPKQYTLMTWQGGLGLPEREYYLQTDAKVETRVLNM